MTVAPQPAVRLSFDALMLVMLLASLDQHSEVKLMLDRLLRDLFSPLPLNLAH